MRGTLTTALLAALLGGCNTPSVPLPPPEISVINFTLGGAPNVVEAVGKPHPNHVDARFYVFDQTSGEGVITKASGDGSFRSRPFTGMAGDTVQIYYDAPTGERSDDICTTLQLDVGLISTRCP